MQPWVRHGQAGLVHDLVPVEEKVEVDRARAPAFRANAAEVLLDRLLEIERQLGRVREGPRYGPRTIDLDLLLYGDEVVEEPGLSVPHPRLAERLFVLEPLSALDAGLFVPGQGFVEALIRGLQSKP